MCWTNKIYIYMRRSTLHIFTHILCTTYDVEMICLFPADLCSSRVVSYLKQIVASQMPMPILQISQVVELKFILTVQWCWTEITVNVKSLSQRAIMATFHRATKLIRILFFFHTFCSQFPCLPRWEARGALLLGRKSGPVRTLSSTFTVHTQFN